MSAETMKMPDPIMTPTTTITESNKPRPRAKVSGEGEAREGDCVEARSRALGRIVRGGQVIEPNFFRSYAQNLDGVQTTGSYGPDLFPISRNQKCLAPAILLAEPKKILASLNPSKIVDHIDPGGIVLPVNLLNGTGVSVGQEHIICVLQPIQMLEHQIARIASPFHAGDVGV